MQPSDTIAHTTHRMAKSSAYNNLGEGLGQAIVSPCRVRHILPTNDATVYLNYEKKFDIPPILLG
jgi:hypothetical protein